jgi:hypothetical protein
VGGSFLSGISQGIWRGKRQKTAGFLDQVASDVGGHATGQLFRGEIGHCGQIGIPLAQ